MPACQQADSLDNLHYSVEKSVTFPYFAMLRQMILWKHILFALSQLLETGKNGTILKHMEATIVNVGFLKSEIQLKPEVLEK